MAPFTYLEETFLPQAEWPGLIALFFFILFISAAGPIIGFIIGGIIGKIKSKGKKVQEENVQEKSTSMG
jgi:hypothetical protein